MMNLVTARIDSGIRAATRRKKNVDITTAGAASHTNRITGGMFLSALSRSPQLGISVCFIAGLAVAIASFLPDSKRPEFESPGCVEL
jgi:hypothetical protein